MMLNSISPTSTSRDFWSFCFVLLCFAFLNGKWRSDSTRKTPQLQQDSLGQTTNQSYWPEAHGVENTIKSLWHVNFSVYNLFELSKHTDEFSKPQTGRSTWINWVIIRNFAICWVLLPMCQSCAARYFWHGSSYLA